MRAQVGYVRVWVNSTCAPGRWRVSVYVCVCVLIPLCRGQVIRRWAAVQPRYRSPSDNGRHRRWADSFSRLTQSFRKRCGITLACRSVVLAKRHGGPSSFTAAGFSGFGSGCRGKRKASFFPYVWEFVAFNPLHHIVDVGWVKRARGS